LYYTDARADARIAAATTDNLSEGSSNQYFTNARAQDAISVTGDGIQKSAGTISLTTIPVSLGGTGAATAAAARSNLSVTTMTELDRGTAWKSTEYSGTSNKVLKMSNEIDGHSGCWKVIHKLETESVEGNITSVSLVADFQVRDSSNVRKLNSLPDTNWDIPFDGVLQLR